MGDPRVGTDLVRVDVVGVGGDVGDAEELVDVRAGRPQREPREDAADQHHEHQGAGQHHRRVEVELLGGQAGRDEDGADHDRRDHERAALAQADQRDHPREQRSTAGRRDGVAEEVVVPLARQGPHQTGDGGVPAAHPGDGHRGVRLVLAAGQHDRPDDQRQGDQRGGHDGDRRLVLDQQGERAEAHQQAGGREGRTPARLGRPRLEVALDHVGHRLDDVVVDAGCRVGHAGGHGDDAAVLDALDGQPGVGGQLTTVDGDEAVAAVDRGGVEEPDAARELRHQLRDGHGAGQHQVDPARPGSDRDPDQSRTRPGSGRTAR